MRRLRTAAAALFLAAAAPSPPPGGERAPVPAASRDAGCLSCHAGIEPSHRPAKGTPACADCHRGRPEFAFAGDAAAYLRERRTLVPEGAARMRVRAWRDWFEALRERTQIASRLPEGVDLEALTMLKFLLDLDPATGGRCIRFRAALQRLANQPPGGPRTPEDRRRAFEDLSAALARDIPGLSLEDFARNALAQDRRRFLEPIRTGSMPDLRAKAEEGADANILAFQRMFLDAQRSRGKSFEAFARVLGAWEARFAGGLPGLVERRRAASELQRALEEDDPRYAMRGKDGRFQPLPDDLPIDEMREIVRRMDADWADRWARVMLAEPAFLDAQFQAHDGLVVRPADFPVARETCGECHKEIAARSLLSTHATAAGVMASVRRFSPSAPKDAALFGAQPAEAADGSVRLAPFPPKGDPRRDLLTYEGRTLDYAAKNCSSCHLWIDTRIRGGGRTVSMESTARGGHRLGGCAACHLSVSPSGGHKGGDPTLPPEESDEANGHLDRVFRVRPERHSIVRKPASAACLACHHCAWSVGPGFEGLVERQETDARIPGAMRRFGRFWEPSAPGVHRERGMECADCHRGTDVHGGGRVALRAGPDTSVRCVSCHATPTRAPQPPRGIVLDRRHGAWFFKPSDGGRARRIPDASSAQAAHRVAAHMERLECIACHAADSRTRDAPIPTLRLFGTDPDRPAAISGPDDARGQWNFQDGETTPWRWVLAPKVLESGRPLLGWTSAGRLSPMIPAPRAPPEGVPAPLVVPPVPPPSGWMPLSSHAIRKEARACESCHADPAAFVPAGAPASHVPGARGLAPSEIRKIMSVDWKKGAP